MVLLLKLLISKSLNHRHKCHEVNGIKQLMLNGLNPSFIIIIIHYILILLHMLHINKTQLGTGWTMVTLCLQKLINTVVNRQK